MVNAEAIKAEYAPYNKMQAFIDGYSAYMDGSFCNIYFHKDVAAQAYDRGAEAAMRVQRAEQWVMNNVGLD